MENTDIKKNSWFIWAFTEVSLVTIIILVGWFLIGYYTKFEYFETGYKDWIYHAFRVRDIAQFGITSWDHIWGNGLNHWRAFQYAEHVLTYWVTVFTGFSITHAMLWISVVAFIAIRVLTYMVMRFLGINRLFSFFAVIVSYAFSQQWTALKEYSIFIGHIILPVYVLLWVIALKDNRYIYLLAAVAGASWSLHPVVGYSASGMFFLLLLVNNLKKTPWRLIVSGGVFLISSLPFTFPYFFLGYSISNPFYDTSRFLQVLLIPESYGLSLFYFVLLGISWCIMLWKSNESPRWAKILLFYCTAYLIFIYFGLLGYYPTYINKFQFSRAIPFIAFLLSFCFAAFFQAAFGQLKSRMVTTVFLALIVVAISQSIEIASLYSGQPTQAMKDPVAVYFEDRDIPQGSIYFRDVTQASYFAKQGMRFVASYNQHLLPNPYPMRFDTLMKTDISYTGVTENQIRLINDYSLVLGVEYLFIPELSPLVDALTTSQNSFESAFEKIDEVNTGADVYAVLRNHQSIAYAYVFEAEDRDSLFYFSDLPKPTLRATSYNSWDREISRMATLIREEKLQPTPVSFVWPNQLVIDTSRLSSFHHPHVLIAQSYDKAWEVNEEKMNIEPTNLRFMYVNIPENFELDQISLKNEWPWWYWPVQSAGIVMVILTSLGVVISFLYKRKSVVGIL